MKRISVLLLISGAVITLLLMVSYYRQPLIVYRVDFDPNGGSPVPSVYVEKNDYLRRPPEPIRAGYFFAGWYLYKSDQPFSFHQTRINSYTKLVAQWH